MRNEEREMKSIQINSLTGRRESGTVLAILWRCSVFWACMLLPLSCDDHI